MNAKEFIKYLLFGTVFPEEYLCLPSNEIGSDLTLELQLKNGTVLDITMQHLFIGYKPVILGVLLDPEALDTEGIVLIRLFHALKKRKISIGELRLKAFQQVPFQNQVCYLLEGVSGKHQLMSRFHQFTGKLLHNYKANKSDAIYFTWSTFQQVKMAYALPRAISLISLGEENRFNMFPTDLHGLLTSNTYVISLRMQGKAFAQVDRIKKIVLCSIAAEHYKVVYGLGKRHMKDLTDVSELPISGLYSVKYHLPLAVGTLEYRELELERIIEHGVHQLLFFKVNSHVELIDVPHLRHIHVSYAHYRRRNKMQTNYLIRNAS